MINLGDAYELLDAIGQPHLLKYYDELNAEEQQALLAQIENTDFSVLGSLDDKSSSVEKKGKISPLKAVTCEEIDKKRSEYSDTGIDAIRNGKVAAVLLAGGQGTRLGFEKPKGMYDIGVDRTLYIFECLVNNLMEVTKKCGAWVMLYVMTSPKTLTEIEEFFEEHNYFGYSKDHVKFFAQDMAPSVDFDGKVYMESKGIISMSPNGNGGWFSSMVRAGLLNEIKRKGIEWINVFAVDNVLQRIADPAFIGAVIQSGCQSGGKVVSKACPEEKVGVLCLEDGRPSIVEYYEMPDKLRNMREPDGQLTYNYGVILNYIFKVDKLEEIADAHMPIHVVKKKIPYMDDNGNYVKPESDNGYKFETLVLDMIHMQDSCLSYEVDRNYEFAPVKNLEGADSVDTAREMLKANGVEL